MIAKAKSVASDDFLSSLVLLTEDTLPETNIDPENGWLEYYFPIGKAYFQGQTVSFRECTIFFFFEDHFLHSHFPRAVSRQLLTKRCDSEILEASPKITMEHMLMSPNISFWCWEVDHRKAI